MNRPEKCIAADVSTHLVPVVNIAALQLLRESNSEENDCIKNTL